MKPPKLVRIGQTAYDVLQVSECVYGDFGEIFYPDGVINLRQRQTRKQKQGTLLHECLHGIGWEYGIKIPEKLILQIEQPLVELLQKNPRLTDFLRKR